MRISDWSSDVCSSDLAICNRRTIVAEITVEDPALAQRRTLRRHRSFATALLVAMGLIYVGATWLGETGFWLDLLPAGTEAALVGGLPDWFAVPALFHPPLGPQIRRASWRASGCRDVALSG